MNIPLSYYFYSILLTFVSSQSVVQDFSTISNVNLRNLLLVDNNVLVGSTSNLFRLDAENLNIQNTINLAGANRLLLPLTNTDVDGDVLSCQEQSCVLFDSNNLETKITVNIPSSNVAESLVPGSDDMVGVGGVNETFFIARDHLIEPGIESTISKFSYAPSDEELGLSLIGRHIESNRFFQRKFLTTFEDGSFVYFVYDLLIDGNPDLRVVRLCANETGGANSILTTYTEVTLSCNGVSSESEFASATLVTVGNNLMILVTQHFDSTNYICSYNVTDIDQAMDNKLEQCKDGIGNFNLQRNGGGTCPTGLTEAQQSVRYRAAILIVNTIITLFILSFIYFRESLLVLGEVVYNNFLKLMIPCQGQVYYRIHRCNHLVHWHLSTMKALCMSLLEQLVG